MGVAQNRFALGDPLSHLGQPSQSWYLRQGHYYTSWRIRYIMIDLADWSMISPYPYYIAEWGIPNPPTPGATRTRDFPISVISIGRALFVCPRQIIAIRRNPRPVSLSTRLVSQCISGWPTSLLVGSVRISRLTSLAGR